MRTILMALVLGLICTTQSYAQPEVITTDSAAPPAPVTQDAVTDSAPETVVVEKTVKPVAAAPVVEPVCVNGTCAVRKIQPVRNLVVKPIVNVVKSTSCAIKQTACQTKVRVQRFRQCRPRLFKRRCR